MVTVRRNVVADNADFPYKTLWYFILTALFFQELEKNGFENSFPCIGENDCDMIRPCHVDAMVQKKDTVVWPQLETNINLYMEAAFPTAIGKSSWLCPSFFFFCVCVLLTTLEQDILTKMLVYPSSAFLYCGLLARCGFKGLSGKI